MLVGNRPLKSEHSFSDNTVFEEIISPFTTSEEDTNSVANLKPTYSRESSSLEASTVGVSSDNELLNAYDREAEYEHARAITNILQTFDTSYGDKVLFQGKKRIILFWSLTVAVGLFSLGIIVIAGYTLFAEKQFSIPDVVSLVTVLISLVIAVLELVKIIINYCFPDKDEEYIVKIVESIQHNDLERYKEVNRSTEARYEYSKKKDSA